MGFIIKKTLTATQEHPTRAGEVLEFTLIKRGYVRDADFKPYFDYEVYKTRGIAERIVRDYIKSEYKDNLWISKYEIVEV